MRRGVATLVAVLSSFIVALPLLGAVPQQERPPASPITYKGDVLVQGAPAPAVLTLVACVIDCVSYQSEPVLTRDDGSYFALVVGPPNDTFLDQQITFWIVTEPGGRIRATETAVYEAITSPSDLTPILNLRFDDPVPTPPPATPTPIPTATPTPTATPVLPIPGDPSVRNLPRTALILGIAALLAGGMILLLVRRRRAL